MLKKLSIQNYAIIDEVDISLSEKMNIVTGETGAGKSIILGALGLILGERADSSVLVNSNRKSIVEGVFNADNKKGVILFLKENELDTDDEIVIRREVSASGKSRAFINDTPVNLEQLRQLSSLLVDLHQQFDTQQLGQNEFQLNVLDALAGHLEILAEYQLNYNKWKSFQKELEELKNQKQQFDKEADYNQFQYNELNEAELKPNELEETDTELKLLNNAEEIKAVLEKVNYDLKESEIPIVQQLKIIANQLQNFSAFHPGLSALIERIQSARTELQDIADEISGFNNHIHYSPDRLQLLNEKLSSGYRLLKKHGVKTTAELIEIKENLALQLKAVLNIDETIKQKEELIAAILKSLKILAKKISEGRILHSKPFEEKVNKLLHQVGMPNAKLKVEIKPANNFQPSGCDDVEFLFDANRSGQFLPVKKVASGGELSRLMLCIKSLVAKKIDLPTMIFDEIDTGISGEAAKQVGIIMKELTEKRQLICITHQPQIAGKADAHFFVYKDIINDKVKTNIRKLSGDERITVIAKMLSGEKPTAAALANAREMLSN